MPGSSDVISEDATPLDLGLTPESILEARPAGPAPAAERRCGAAPSPQPAVPPAGPAACRDGPRRLSNRDRRQWPSCS